MLLFRLENPLFFYVDRETLTMPNSDILLDCSTFVGVSSVLLEAPKPVAASHSFEIDSTNPSTLQPNSHSRKPSAPSFCPTQPPARIVRQELASSNHGREESGIASHGFAAFIDVPTAAISLHHLISTWAFSIMKL